VLIMRSFLRSRVLGLSSLTMLCLAGCSQDNESFVKAQATANAGAPAPATPATAPKNQVEYGQQRQQMQPGSMPAGYPGAKK
jgi:hypothetical protein